MKAFWRSVAFFSLELPIHGGLFFTIAFLLGMTGIPVQDCVRYVVYVGVGGYPLWCALAWTITRRVVPRASYILAAAIAATVGHISAFFFDVLIDVQVRLYLTVMTRQALKQLAMLSVAAALTTAALVAFRPLRGLLRQEPSTEPTN